MVNNTSHPPPFPSAAERGRAEVDAALALRGPFKPLPDPEEDGYQGLGGADGAILVSGADLCPRPMRWLWPGWLALGKFHLLAGTPGQGKTTIAMTLAATVTQGGTWPDGTHCHEPGNVLVWSGEDDPADTLLPRLLAAGADRSRCFFVRGTRLQGEEQPFDPAHDMPALEREAQRVGSVRMVVMDPVVSAVAGDSHKNGEVRRALQPLADLASRLGAVVLGISHLSKGGAGDDPVSRVLGSVAFIALSRLVLMVARVPGVEPGPDGEPTSRRVFVRGKSNVGPDEGGYEYIIEQLQALPGLPDIGASRIVWGAPVTASLRELQAEPKGDDEAGGGKSAMEAACDWLHQFLGQDQVPASAVRAEAAQAGVAWATLRRAAHDLCVIKTKGGVSGQWFWKLPKKLS